MLRQLLLLLRGQLLGRSHRDSAGLQLRRVQLPSLLRSAAVRRLPPRLLQGAQRQRGAALMELLGGLLGRAAARPGPAGGLGLPRAVRDGGVRYGGGCQLHLDVPGGRRLSLRAELAALSYLTIRHSTLHHSHAYSCLLFRSSNLATAMQGRRHTWIRTSCPLLSAVYPWRACVSAHLRVAAEAAAVQEARGHPEVGARLGHAAGDGPRARGDAAARGALKVRALPRLHHRLHRRLLLLLLLLGRQGLHEPVGLQVLKEP